LIIGYDEDPGMAPVPAFPPLEPGDRGGSHNLVIGRWHRFTQAAFGGFIAGEANFIINEGASVSGGFTNTASGDLSSVTGGQDNTASGFQASVTGGQANLASGQFATVSGGAGNIARGFLGSAVSGGSGNIASGSYASVSGGQITTASGDFASVTGGRSNQASGTATVVIGGVNVTDNNNNSIAPQAASHVIVICGRDVGCFSSTGCPKFRTFSVGSPKSAIQSSGVVPRAGVFSVFRKVVSIAVPAIESVAVENRKSNARREGFATFRPKMIAIVKITARTRNKVVIVELAGDLQGTS
jgi:hypothetical protein